ncbi:hypothetical protein [Lacrimispora brassicae]
MPDTLFLTTEEKFGNLKVLPLGHCEYPIDYVTVGCMDEIRKMGMPLEAVILSISQKE